MFTKKSLSTLLVFILLSILTSVYIDIPFSKMFFTSQGFLKDHTILKMLFKYTIIPAWILFIIAVSLLIMSYHKVNLYRYRHGLYTLILTLVVGSGIISNAILKDHWGRPRPIQTREFGGPYQYKNIHQLNWSWNKSDTRSFPSGHSTMGFYFIALYIFASRYKLKKLKTISLILTIALSGLIGFTRLAQGGHYLSDILVSALIMGYTAYIIDKLLNKRQKYERTDAETA